MKCECCDTEHDGTYGSGRFCSSKCARGFSTKNKRQEINAQVSKSLTGRKLEEEHRKKAIDALVRSGRIVLKERIIRQCLSCNCEMSCRPSDKRKFCSAKCWVNYTEQNKDKYLLYRQRCNFKFDVYDYPDKFDLSLAESLGWYSPSNKKNNLDGVSRDHMYSVNEGFKNGIDPSIIAHPANCRVIQHRSNQSKRAKSSITLEELMERIKSW
jgi:hypothetical protein